MKEDNEVNKSTETEQFVYKPSMVMNKALPVQTENTQRLDNFEVRMNQAFSLLTNMSGKFDYFMNIQTPYVNTNRTREFNNRTTNLTNKQQCQIIGR